MKTINFYHNDYISRCDLINKYNSQHLYEIPKIANIIIELPLSQIVNLSNKNLSLKNLFMKTYFMFYILFGFKPYINYKAVKVVDKNYSLKFKISNSFQIQYFLHFLFLYLSSNSFLNFLFNFDVKKNLTHKEKKPLVSNCKLRDLPRGEKLTNGFDPNKKLNFLFKIPAFCFYQLNMYCDFFLSNINLKELFFFINIVFTDKDSDIRKLKNFQCFWSLETKYLKN